MSKLSFTEEEKKINKVLKHQDALLQSVQRPDMECIEERIADSEAILKDLGITLDNVSKVGMTYPKKLLVVPTWDEMLELVEKEFETDVDLEELFSEKEILSNKLIIKQLNEEYRMIHRLDKMDISIAAAAGILGAMVDILLIGIPEKTKDGLRGRSLAVYVRDWFDKILPEEDMKKLANSKKSKVPYDAQDNRNTTIDVNGLSAYYHRMLELGHDPLLGFFVGVFDIMTGRMTTIDKKGKFVSQVMENYSDRKESELFEAIAKQMRHLMSDATTSMGLPVPLMGLFNLLQFGNIDDQTIAEIVQGMYYEGYDFIHFCSMSISSMIIEVFIRVAYAAKRIGEGNSLKEAIPVSTNRKKNPKLGTMLFIGHSAASGINAGKVLFAKNPMAINYPQWIAFARYSYTQLKWVLYDKSIRGDEYVRGIIADDLAEVYRDIEEKFQDLSKDYTVVFQ